MPPMPEPSQASALASAGSRADATDLGGDILERDRGDPRGAECHQHGDKRRRSDMTQEALVSTEENGGLQHYGEVRRATLLDRPHRI